MRFTLKFNRSALLAATLMAGAIGYSAPSQAYFSHIDTGELLAPGGYQVGIEPQLVLSRFEGLNAVGRVEMGINDSSSAQGLLGIGTVDFQVGAFYKFIPFPDTANQPAIGGKVGLIIARNGGETETSVRLHPMLSKRFETEIGDLTAYGALPFGVTNRTGGAGNTTPVQIAAGAELRTLDWPRMSFFSELGLNVNDAFSYLSFAAAYRFQ
jgi:hypothetical protein